jgi:hypothetical protein
VTSRAYTILIEHMKCGATNTVQNAADQIDRGVRSVSGRRALGQAISVFVEKQPFVALMIAVGISYIGARVLRR